MYLPRSLISHLYTQLVRSHHALSPPILILVALEPDALCACRILTSLLKRDYMPHKVKPISGYNDLTTTGREVVQPMRIADGGSGGVVCCVGMGGLVDLEAMLGLEVNEDGIGGADGVDVWIFDAKRPWNLSNVFGGLQGPKDEGGEPRSRGVQQGQIMRTYKPGTGGIVVFDDGDIREDLGEERDAWFALEEMPEDDGDMSDASDSNEEDERTQGRSSRKRKSFADDGEASDSEKENARPRQRRRSNSSTPIPSSQNQPSYLDSTPPSNQHSSPPNVTPSPPPKQLTARQLRRRLNRLRLKHESTIRAYHSKGTSYAEPISSLMYSLASELGREDNDLLWLTILGVTSTEIYGRTPHGISLSSSTDPATNSSLGWNTTRGSRIRQLLRDEVRRLNPPELTESGREAHRGHATDSIPIHARSPTDTSIRLSPEPRFLLVRHWSLYDSMLHSPYLSAKLHIWSDAGRRRLHKLLAKMGVSLAQCRQSYTHMDVEVKKVLRERLLHFAPVYGLEGLLPPASSGRGHDREGWGFVRSWGWKACLSAVDVAVVVGAVLEVGARDLDALKRSMRGEVEHADKAENALTRFYAAYDALLSPTKLTAAIPLAQSLHRAILRTGTSLLQKRQIRHLRAFRMALVKEGPDVRLFCSSGALMKLALWVGEAVKEGGSEKDREGEGTPLVLGALDEGRGVYVLVGMGGGGSGVVDGEERRRRKLEREARKKEKERRREEKRVLRERRRRKREGEEDEETLETEDDDEDSSDVSSESDDNDDDSGGVNKEKRNKFGNAFQEVVEETNARVRLDSFEHCVVEVKKEDLSGFLEALSMKAVVG